jgi:hypothetical protein
MPSRRSLLFGACTVALGCAGFLCAISPGRPPGLVDDAGRPVKGSLSERVVVPINGVPQGMIIQSTDISHPVVLF